MAELIHLFNPTDPTPLVTHADGTVCARDTVNPGSGERQPGRCLYGNGTTQRVDIGDTTNAAVRSISFWVKADDITAHTDGIYKLNATDKLSIVNGTVTIAGQSGSVRVDDAASAVIPDITGWHFVVIELDATVDADAMSLLYDGTTYGGVYLFDVRLASRVWTAAEQTAMRRQGLRPELKATGQPADVTDVWYLDDSSTTVARNAVAGRTDGTVIAGTAGMLYEGDDVPYSPQNLYGFTEA